MMLDNMFYSVSLVLYYSLTVVKDSLLAGNTANNNGSVAIVIVGYTEAHTSTSHAHK